MIPISIAEGTGLILSLIPLFHRERDKGEAASREKFFEWLIGHNFNNLTEQIQSNYDLCTEIETLLQMNQEQLLARFDEVDQKLFRIMNSMQEFRNLVKIVAPKTRLTEQEESILRQFVESEDFLLRDDSNLSNPISWGTNSGTEIIVKNVRTIGSSISKLAELGFMRECIGGSGSIYYELTEDGIEYVDNLKESDLSEQAKSVLKQYVESGEQYLCTLVNGQGQVDVMANSIDIKVDNNRFIYDDIEELEKRGFIRFDGDMGVGRKRYTLTRMGMEFI
jgi:DNA-binding PadR family transcriptional regulator